MSLHTLSIAPSCPMRERGPSKASLREVAALLKLDLPAEPWVDTAAYAIRRVDEGHAVYRSGEAFRCLYVVRFGCLKTVLSNTEGTEQIVAFPMKGDVVGLDGLGGGQHGCEAIALEMSEVIAVPFDELLQLSQQCPSLLLPLYRLFGRELARENQVIYKIASLHAEARVAAFLIELSDRYGALGYSRREFQLRMKRQEIGSYLGLKLETVSRALSALDAAGIITVHKKSIEIDDFARLHQCAENAEPTPPAPAARTARRATPSYPAWLPRVGAALPVAA